MSEIEIKLFSYCRVLTKKQRDTNNIKIQENAIKKWMRYNNKYLIIRGFKDDGISAFKERPEYNKMLELLFDGEADGIIIKALSRIGRSVKQLVNLVDKLIKHNKVFIVLDQNINTGSKEGRLFFHMMAGFVEYEADLFRERVAEGMRKYVEEGGILGRPRIITDEKIINKIKKWYNVSRLGFVNICKLLKAEDPPIIVTQGTIRNILIKEKVKIRGIYDRS
ncbi:hypothetical protein LCGC14_0664840 [marine sediment metagenome]|uniref:Resolvase/invertase-type recombinase catalytic domain-containing protein n=1 Tax=marine sediment metagenome TaxID=412755 RepID=A0A0F9U0W0_9ZZZZ